MGAVRYEVTDILNEITGSPDGVGYDVSLSKIYDDIRNARVEEDDSLSLGIWERDLKKADWELVARLSFEALKEHSKDFQILGWLIEAEVVLNGFAGIANGIAILTKFTEIFWEFGYPRNEDNSSDDEQKFRILEWIYNTVSERSKFIPFISLGKNDGINLYNYEYAIDMRNTAIKSPDRATEILESAKMNNVKTVDDIQNIVSVTSKEEVNALLNVFQEIKDAKHNFEQTISNFSKENSIGIFASLLGNIDRIEKAILSVQRQKNGNRNEEKDLSVDEVTPQQYYTRNEIYDKIEDFAKKLMLLERHSPSSCILKLVVSWKDKNLLEIINDLKSGDSESHKLLKFLMT
ncbi:MAG: type VI secretion system ImpA family N-terminal domain-containing protein [Holosporales bacterium]|jgi:type VI secretion system ImpA family protein|nr:type VI secretion system ImpA family N-terminal domain-containing protein [Holosporales bacterium]